MLCSIFEKCYTRRLTETVMDTSTLPGVNEQSTVVDNGSIGTSSSSSSTFMGVVNVNLTEVRPEGSASSWPNATFVIRRSLCG
jgi:hypothetical protein